MIEDRTPVEVFMLISSSREDCANGSGSFAECHEILMNAPVGIFQATAEGRLLAVNPALVRMLGYETVAQLSEAITDIGAQLSGLCSSR